MNCGAKSKGKKNQISLWGYDIPRKWLTPIEFQYLNELPERLPDVIWVCNELDRIWGGLKLKNDMPLNSESITNYYTHPVWLMNGIFTICDPQSLMHRMLIAKYLAKGDVKTVADYGGGLGQLALCIASENEFAEIHIIEPYPSRVGVERLRRQPQIKIVQNLTSEYYDVVIAQDVLEHVVDPVKLAYEIASQVKNGGEVIFANCFYPSIQCHLPSTFHLRHTFIFVMKALGLRFVKTLEGAPHIQIFQRVGSLNLIKARNAELASKPIGTYLNFQHDIFALLKSNVKRLIIKII